MKSIRILLVYFGFLWVVSACSVTQAPITPLPTSASATQAITPEWFDMQLTDVQTGETFTMSDYAGKVVLLETMAIWCPNCLVQGNEIRNLHKLLGDPDDLVSVSLDVDVNEDSAALKQYASQYGYEWHFAVAPLLVARALGNLYTAQYLNPPLNPMMLIDRQGQVHHMEYGLKEADELQKFIQPFLEK